MGVNISYVCFPTANDKPGIQGIIAVFAVLIFIYGFAIGLGAASWTVYFVTISIYFQSLILLCVIGHG